MESKISGFKEFSRLLKELPPNVETRVAQRAVMKANRWALPFMRAAAPVHVDKQSKASRKYGTTRDNLRVIRLRYVAKGQKASRIDTGKAFWQLFYNLGSRYQPARPWFANKYHALYEGILSALGKELGEGIEKEAIKLRGNKL